MSLQPLVPVLTPGVVHVWQVWLSEVRPWYGLFLETLSPDERKRAARYRLSEVQERFVLTRGSLRTLLSGYCERTAVSIPLILGRYGKPYVVSPGCSTLFFNLAHSGDLAVFAFARGCEVGIDVERPRQVMWTHSMMRTVFSEDEQTYLATLEPAERQWTACCMWTVKEARAKATGLGLGRSLKAGRPTSEAYRWHTFAITPEHVATVVLYCAKGFKNQGWALTYLRFPG